MDFHSYTDKQHDIYYLDHRYTDIIEQEAITEDYYMIGYDGSVETKTNGEVQLFQNQIENEQNEKKDISLNKTTIFNNKSKLINCNNLNKPLREKIESLSSSVGRLFIRYINDYNKSIVWHSGTGICISEDKVMTTSVVSKFKIGDLTMNAIYIYLENDSTVDIEIDLDDIEDYCYQLTSVKGNKELDILQLVDRNSIKFKYATINQDTFQSIPRDATYFIIYYAGHQEWEDFKSDCSDIKENESKLQSIYRQLTRDCDGFQHKTITFSDEPLEYQSNGIINHKCSTIKGSTGALFGCIYNDQKDVAFIGIQNGGSKQDKVNHAISINHPSFKIDLNLLNLISLTN